MGLLVLVGHDVFWFAVFLGGGLLKLLRLLIWWFRSYSFNLCVQSIDQSDVKPVV